MRRTGPEPNFDRVAHIYRWAEYLALGSSLQSIRKHFLLALNDRYHAHVLGDGDGRFLRKLLESNPLLTAVAVDTSQTMLSLLDTRCASFGSRLRTVNASALSVKPDKNTDLVVSHFFLDCLEQEDVDELIQRVARSCRPSTKWLVSDFQIPNKSLLRPLGHLYIRGLYFAFKILTGLSVHRLPQTREAFWKANFERIAYHQSLGGLLYSEIWELHPAPSPKAQPATEVETSTSVVSQKFLMNCHLDRSGAQWRDPCI